MNRKGEEIDGGISRKNIYCKNVVFIIYFCYVFKCIFIYGVWNVIVDIVFVCYCYWRWGKVSWIGYRYFYDICYCDMFFCRGFG